jgi:hypothetical protein
MNIIGVCVCVMCVPKPPPSSMTREDPETESSYRW